MTNNWESRERNTKRIALILSLMLHVAVIVAITHAAGKDHTQDNTERVTGKDTVSKLQKSKEKV